MFLTLVFPKQIPNKYLYTSTLFKRSSPDVTVRSRRSKIKVYAIVFVIRIHRMDFLPPRILWNQADPNHPCKGREAGSFIHQLLF
jgi:hypothetical protein